MGYAAVRPSPPAGLAGSTGVLVLGMHRSGTSAVSGVLYHLGVQLGRTVSPAGPSNPKGYFENTRVMLLHEELLASFGTTWDDPRALPAGWSDDHRLAPWRNRLAAILEDEFGGAALWGIKDPRLCRLLSFWLPLLEQASVRAVAVLVVRHPGAVAASNARRTAMAQEQAIELWLEHTLAAERDTRRLPRAVLSYERLLANWQHEIADVAARLNLPLNFDASRVAQVKAFLDGDLQHNREGDAALGDDPLGEQALRVWRSLTAPTGGGVDRGALDAVAAERRRCASTAAAVSQYLAHRAAAERRGDEAARDISRWQAELEALTSELARVREEVNQTAALLAQRDRQVASLTATLAGLTATRWFKVASWYWRLCARLRGDQRNRGAPTNQR